MSFWSELKRRNVYKVAVAYAIVAWLILQVASITFPALNLPTWALTLLTVFIIVCFPLVLIFAWAFEITPEGLKRTHEVPHHESITHITGRKLNYVLTGLLIVAVALLIFDNYYLDRRAIETEVASRVAELAQPAVNEEEAPLSIPTTDEEDSRKTIAVLPFDDLSPDSDQGYFVDGLSEELLNLLAKIPDFSVTSKTSAFSFKDKDKTVKEIASALGVGHILEGSVRKAGNTLRLTAQLIRAADDSHLWSNQYDRELKNVEDILSIQEDIATAVANELKVTLGIGEALKQLGGTENKEAYELYLVAQGQFGGIGRDPSASVERALESIDAAIAADPEFALAWSSKARGLSLLGESDEGLKAAQKAIELEPNMAGAYSALGELRFAKGEYIKSQLAFQKAAELTGKPSVTISSYGNLLQRFGYLERTREAVAAALEIDPLNEGYLVSAVEIFGRLGDLQKAEEANERHIEITGDVSYTALSINGARLLSGNVVSSDDIVDPNPISVALKEYVGSPEEGLTELRRFYNDADYQNPPSLASIWMWAAYFGDTELAMDAMEKFFYLIGFHDIVWYPAMKQVRQQPRFRELLREMGLVDYWEQFGWPDLCHPTDDGDFECD